MTVILTLTMMRKAALRSRPRPSSARQEILAKDPNYFKKQQAAKAKADLQATLRADESTDVTETEPETKIKPARKAANKPSTAKKFGPAASRSTKAKAATIQNGTITKQAEAKKQQEKPKRKHRKADYGYESVPEESDEELGNRNTIAKLRETIDPRSLMPVRPAQQKAARRSQKSQPLGDVGI